MSFVLAAGLAPPALAQHDAAHGSVGWVPREILEQKIDIRQGVGNVHEKVATTSAEAQAFYDQGLNYLHSFEWINSARSFNQALRIDTKLAMADVGLISVYIELQDDDAVRTALAKAQSLSSTSALERQRIEISAKLAAFSEDRSGDMQSYFAYRKAIDDALLENPNDPWLWIIRGFADEGSPTGHGQGGHVDSIAFYRTALSLSPNNSAAHHYLAHTYENLGMTQQALDESAAYVQAASAIPHAHHMHGHELRRIGRTREAIAEFLEAQKLEKAAYTADNIPSKYDWHHAHNLELLALCYQTTGQMKAAEPVLREAFALPAHTDIAEYNRGSWPEFLLGRGRAQEALEASTEMVQSSSGPLGRFAGHALAGRALLALGRLEEANTELTKSEAEMQKLSGASLRNLPNAEMLRAEFLLRLRRLPEGEALMKQMEERIRAMSGPDAWSEALFQLQSIAQVARSVDDWSLAEFTAHEMVEHDPSFAGGYYELGLCAKHRGDKERALDDFDKAGKLWQDADDNLAELVTVRQEIAANQTAKAH